MEKFLLVIFMIGIGVFALFLVWGMMNEEAQRNDKEKNDNS